ncbi:hypothetical protein HYW36_02095 [Candidatus Saccharibacteria bacterium]|nr:hypothetical protein [Candidatus Saccharibacteria bacterium]
MSEQPRLNEHNPFQGNIDRHIERILTHSRIIDGPPGGRVHNIRQTEGTVGKDEANLVLGFTPDDKRRIHLRVTSNNGSQVITNFFEYFPEISKLSTWTYASVSPFKWDEAPNPSDYSDESEYNDAFGEWIGSSLTEGIINDLSKVAEEKRSGLMEAVSIDDWEKFQSTLSKFRVKSGPKIGWLNRLLKSR